MEMHTRQSLADIHGIWISPRHTRQTPHLIGAIKRYCQDRAKARGTARLVGQLEMLDDRLLRDIGLERHQIHAFSHAVFHRENAVFTEGAK